MNVSIGSNLSDLSYATCIDNTLSETTPEEISRTPINTFKKVMSQPLDSNASNEEPDKENRTPNINSDSEDNEVSIKNTMTNTAEKMLELPADATQSDKVIFQMLQLIQGKVTKIEQKTETNRVEAEEDRRRVKEIETKVHTHVEDCKVKNDQLNTCMTQIKQTLQFHETSLMEVKKAIDEINFRASKDIITIDGLAELQREDVVQLVRNFFSQIMLIEETIQILYAYRVGEVTEGKTRTVHVKLINPGQKGLIYKNVANLTGKTNIHGEFFTLNDQVIGERAEHQRRNRDIIKDNKKVTIADRLVYTVKKGSVYEGDTKLTSLLECPSRSMITNLSLQRMEELRQILDTKTTKGETQNVYNSRFIGYTSEVETVEEVNELYTALRLHHMDAQHIVCAFRIPGRQVAKLCDYNDDGELGSGRRILYMLKDAGIYNRAVFVVRYYTEHIGPARFVAYKNAVSAAISLKTYNNIRKETQTPWEMEEIRPRNTGGRGGQGRGGYRGGYRGSRRSNNNRNQTVGQSQKRKNTDMQTCALTDALPGWDKHAAQWKNGGSLARMLFPPGPGQEGTSEANTQGVGDWAQSPPGDT